MEDVREVLFEEEIYEGPTTKVALLPGKPRPGAKEMIDACVRAGMKIIIRSPRCVSPTGRFALVTWLQRHDIIAHELRGI